MSDDSGASVKVRLELDIGSGPISAQLRRPIRDDESLSDGLADCLSDGCSSLESVCSGEISASRLLMAALDRYLKIHLGAEEDPSGFYDSILAALAEHLGPKGDQ